MKTTTTLSIDQKAASLSKYTWSPTLDLELDSGDKVKVVCDDSVFISSFNNYVNLTGSPELDKLPEFTRKCLKNTMTKLYDYFNQEDANALS